MLGQIVKDWSLWEGPMLEKFMKECLLWVVPDTGPGEAHEKEGAAEAKHYELITVLIPCPPAPLRGRKERNHK